MNGELFRNGELFTLNGELFQRFTMDGKNDNSCILFASCFNILGPITTSKVIPFMYD